MKLLEPTLRPERDPGSEAPPAGPPGPGPPRRRLAAALALLVGGAGLAAAAVALLAGGDRASERSAGRPALALRPVASELTARLRGGRGTVRLRVAAEVPAGSPRRLTAIPAGAPVRLSFELPPTAAGRPEIAAHRLQTSLKDMFERGEAAGGGHGKGAEGGHGAGEGRGSERAYAEEVELDRNETFLFSRRSGEIVVPNAGGGQGGAGKGSKDGHGHGGAEPGQGLAGTIPGGGFSAALELPAGAAAGAADPAGRFLVASYPDRGRVEIVDLLRRSRAGAVETGGRPGALAFAPDGRLWISDDEGDRVVVADPATRRIAGELEVASGPKRVAFGGGRALVAAGGRAVLADPASLRALSSLDIGGRAADTAYAGAARAFAVADERGGVALVPLAPRGPDGGLRRVPAGPGTRAVAAGPGGRRIVAAHPRAGTLSVIDARSARIVRTVKAGAEPVDVVFLERFAIARNARSADVTWVDAEEPSRSNNVPLAKAPAAGLALSADGREAIVTGETDRMAVKLHTMMGRPMIMEQVPNAIGADTAVAPAGGLQRTGARRYEQRTVLGRPGRYHLELRLPGGARAEFELPVSAPSGERAVARPLTRRLRARAGAGVNVRFRVEGGAPRDAQVLGFSTSGGSGQLRVPARARPGGVYEAEIRPPAPGTYRLALVSEQAGLRSGAGAGAVLEVTRR